ncbi:zinc finger protein 467-like isoform X2 [Python bivittatus]|uniref:Zinc finger protein 467-like isoform X2 n=1 Tax=Python bivittatus TaxID=176946 RepID=A0A9F2R0Y6_PYTBI|nr:zinc finger protein 467-like isoform X2 [Python bivittatus]
MLIDGFHRTTKSHQHRSCGFCNCAALRKRWIFSLHFFTTSTIPASTRAPFPWTECGKSFVQKPNLVRHLRYHGTGRTHSCDDRRKGFTQTQHLVKYQHTHQAEKGFQCHTCVADLSYPGHTHGPSEVWPQWSGVSGHASCRGGAGVGTGGGLLFGQPGGAQARPGSLAANGQDLFSPRSAEPAQGLLWAAGPNCGTRDSAPGTVPNEEGGLPEARGPNPRPRAEAVHLQHVGKGWCPGQHSASTTASRQAKGPTGVGSVGRA